ncbi:DUF853 family protein [bacterium]|nr:MAG: DUF853 family protein [bacterium]
MSKLKIAEGFALPQEVVTETIGVLARKGSGKTYFVSVLAEEMIKAGLPVVLVDPVGVMWGLRSSADGKGPGLSIVIMGGDHGDVPLEPTAGAVIADVIVDDRISAVLDLSGMRKGEQVRFMTDLAERLYHRNRAPLHLVLDEADLWAPQRPMPDHARLLGAIEDIVRRGRARGLGVSLITQRPGVINKNVLTQIEILVAMRLVSPQDRKALDEWIEVHGEKAQRDELMRTVASLRPGQAWFWSPGFDLFQLAQVRRRETFDSSSTPKVGAKAIRPRGFAEIDLEGLRAKIGQTIERAKADDPKALRRRVAELERELAARPAPQPERIEVPVITAEQVEELRALAASWARSMEAALSAFGEAVRPHLEAFNAALEESSRIVAAGATEITHAMNRVPVRERAKPTKVLESAVPPAAVGDRKLGKAERAILTVLAQFPRGRTVSQIAIQAGYSADGGGFRNALSALRQAGLIERGDPVVITVAGVSVVGNAVEPIPFGPALVAFWQGRLGKAERAILDVLVDVYPRSLSAEEIASRAGYEASGGGFRNALSKLRTLELAEGYGQTRASDALFR